MNIDFSSLGSYLAKSAKILIMLSARPTTDSVAGALSLYLSLKQIGKQVTIACSEPIAVGLNRLIAIDKISDQLGGRNLVASFDYVQDSIEKVSYHIAEGKFNLVIQPKNGFAPLDSQKVSYSYTGSDADLLITLGVSRLENLGNIYQKEQKIFGEKELVNIDISPLNTRFGKLNLISPQNSSCSELVGLLIKNLSLPNNPDIATNIIAGIEAVTANFTTRTGADTFEVVGWCLSSGGRRGQLQTNVPAQTFDTRPYLNQPLRQSIPTQNGYSQFNQNNFNQPSFQPQVQPQVQPQQSSWQPPQPQPQPQTWQQPSLAGQPPEAAQQPQTQPQPQQQFSPSPDWLKPKIYKGSTQV